MKAEKVRNMWVGWARGEDMLDYGRVITQCNHGCVLMIPDGNHPVAIFIDAFFIDCLFGEGSSLAEGKGKHVVDNLSDSFGTQLAVWNDDSHRKMAKDLLLGIGTIMILGNEEKILTVPKEIAYAVMVLENYDGNGDIDSTMTTRYVSAKARDLRSSRDVLKFYRKRLSCSCLKHKHLLARKTTPKMGACYNCGQTKNRAMLSVCSKCRISQYCSRDCQIADWPEHKEHCDIMCEAHAHQRSRKND